MASPSEKAPLLDEIKVDVVGASGSASEPSKRKTGEVDPQFLMWENISFKVVDKAAKKEKLLLQNIHGYAMPGEILAIMGPSGSGKTTLLNVIGARTRASGGTIVLNGVPIGDNVKSMMGFVTQADYLYATLSVKETVMVHAQLRIPESVAYAEKEKRVEELIDQLELTKVKNSFVGDKISKGLSGGERKRVNIACEMIHKPSVLLLDEPTSGLDSSTALEVMRLLRNLASMGHTIICTIHQPRSALFKLIDRVMLLSQGELFFFGDMKQAVTHFAEKGYPCPELSNPADHFVDVLTGTQEELAEADKSVKKARLVPSEFFDSIKVLEEGRKKEIEFSKGAGLSSPRQASGDYVTGFWKQFVILSDRAIKNEFRQPLTSFVAISQTIFMAVLVAALYANSGLEEPKAVGNRTGAIVFIMINGAFSALSSLQLFINEKLVFGNERNGRMYRTSAYYIAKTLAELPLRIFNPLLFTAIFYFAVGFQSDAAKFFVMTTDLMLVAYSAASYSVMLGAVVSDYQTAQILVPVGLTLFLLFGGSSFISANAIPVYFRWIRTISFFNYANVVALVSEFSGLKFTCSGEDLISVPCETGTCKICKIPDGESVLRSQGLDDEKVWVGLLALVAISFVFRLLAYIGLYLRYKPVKPFHEPRIKL